MRKPKPTWLGLAADESSAARPGALCGMAAQRAPGLARERGSADLRFARPPRQEDVVHDRVHPGVSVVGARRSGLVALGESHIRKRSRGVDLVRQACSLAATVSMSCSLPLDQASRKAERREFCAHCGNVLADRTHREDPGADRQARPKCTYLQSASRRHQHQLPAHTFVPSRSANSAEATDNRRVAQVGAESGQA